MGIKPRVWYDADENGNIPDDAPALCATNLNRIENNLYKALKKDIGCISFYCNTVVPDGWLYCDGRAVSRELYSDLYDCIGETFGAGDGLSTFNIPDLRGEFIRGWNNSSDGIDANRGFASKQDATRFTDDSFGSRYVSDGEDSGTVSESTGGYSMLRNEKSIGIRPNNIALLPCIFTGVFSDD